MSELATVILAAGEGKRLGVLKPLAELGGETLLARTIRTVKSGGCDNILVVVSNKHWQKIAVTLSDEVNIIVNDEWQEGIASSIRSAVSRLQTQPIEAILFSACDQPFVDSKLIKSILDSFLHTQSQVVASSYDGTAGIPALFRRSLFPLLLELKGDRGAKQIIAASDSLLIDAPQAKFDIDTNENLIQCRMALQEQLEMATGK